VIEHPIDVLCIFGRGIEKDERGIWQPTAYLEEMTSDNQHGGQRKNGLRLSSENPRVVIAGAYANAMAAAHIWNGLHWNNLPGVQPPSVVVFAAGRPKYLQAEPPDEVWEGKPLYDAMKNSCAENPAISSEIVFQRDNRNTRDDLLQTLKMARSRRFKNVAIVSVLVHLRRIAEFLRHALIEDPSLATINTILYSSELVLASTGNVKNLLLLDDPKVAGPLNHLTISRIIESPTFRRTAEREKRGIEDLREGRYDFGHQGYQFAK